MMEVLPKEDRPMFRRSVRGVCRLWLPGVTSRPPTSMDEDLKSGINLAPGVKVHTQGGGKITCRAEPWVMVYTSLAS